MNIFQVIQPSSLLVPYIRQYWFLRLEDVQKSSQRILPSGSTGVYFLLQGSRIKSLLNENLLPQSYLYGQSIMYDNLVYSGTVSFIAIIFQPTGAQAFFRFPLIESNNQKIPLDALNDPQITELEKRLIDISDPKVAVNLIETLLLHRIQPFGNEYNRHRLSTVIHSIEKGEQDIHTLAQTACLGKKQFRRLFTEFIGINPKDFLRIVRCQKILHSLQTRNAVTLTQLAEEYGYYDKSHLIREMRELTGYVPKDFLAVCDPYSDYHALFRSTFIDNP